MGVAFALPVVVPVATTVVTMGGAMIFGIVKRLQAVKPPIEPPPGLKVCAVASSAPRLLPLLTKVRIPTFAGLLRQEGPANRYCAGCGQAPHWALQVQVRNQLAGAQPPRYPTPHSQSFSCHSPFSYNVAFCGGSGAGKSSLVGALTCKQAKSGAVECTHTAKGFLFAENMYVLSGFWIAITRLHYHSSFPAELTTHLCIHSPPCPSSPACCGMSLARVL